MTSKRSAAVFCIVVFFTLSAAGAHAYVFREGHRLFQIQTGHFLIIFPEECRRDAERLAGFADEVYSDIGADLDAGTGLKLPVVLSPDTDEVNGYFSNTLYNHIVLYRAPVDPDSELGNMKDDLRTIFLHELTHAVSLNVRGGFWAFISALFGDIVSPNEWWMMPGDFIEGVTVAMESRDGFGRAHEPFVLQAVRQDILEGKARDFYGAAGGDDRYPGRALYYWYGGLFSTYLRNTYGAEKYAQLWKDTGGGNFFTGLDGFLFFKGAFEAVYGLPLQTAWNAFLSTIAYRAPIVTATRPLSEAPGKIAAVAAGGNALYWADSAAGALFERDESSGAVRRLFSYGSLLNRIDTSADGSTLLLSWGRMEGDFARLFVRAWDLKAGSFVGPEYPGLRDAAYFGGSGDFVALQINGFQTDLVLVTHGERRTLLNGSPLFAFADPCVLDDGKIAFMLKIDGESSIARMDLATGGIELLRTAEPLGRITGLSTGAGRLVFSRATEDDFPSLAVLTPDGLLAQKTAVSGGVTTPVVMGSGEIRYVGRFSDGMRVCAYPDDNPSLALTPMESHWEPLPADRVPNAGLGAAAGSTAAVSPWREEPFNVFPWLLPRTWIPNALLGPTGLDAAGAMVFSIDPAETWTGSVGLLYDWTRQFADLSLSLSFSPMPIGVSLSANDQVSFYPLQSGYLRKSEGSVNLMYYAYLFPDNALAVTNVNAAVTALAPETPGAPTAYQWPFQSYLASGGISFTYIGARSNTLKPGERPTGFSGVMAVDSGMELGPQFSPAIAGQLNIGYSLGAWGLSLECYGAMSPNGLPVIASLSFQPGGIVRTDGSASGISPRYPPYKEYAFYTPNPALAWRYAFFDASLMPLSVDVMKAARDLKLFATRVALVGGYRGALAGDRYLDSAYGRLLLQGTMPQGAFSTLILTIYGEVSYAIRAEDFGRMPVVFDMGLGLGL